MTLEIKIETKKDKIHKLELKKELLTFELFFLKIVPFFRQASKPHDLKLKLNCWLFVSGEYVTIYNFITNLIYDKLLIT
jgi:hypothetical protein